MLGDEIRMVKDPPDKSYEIGQTRASNFVDARASRASTLCKLCNERMDDKSLTVSGSSPRENRHIVNDS